MKTKTLIALLFVGHLCQLSQSSRKSRHYRNGNVKKSFLADAMNEMEYGSAHPPPENKTNVSKTDPNRIVSIRRIYPSNIVNVVDENSKVITSSASTPNLTNKPSNIEDKGDHSTGQANKDINVPPEIIVPSVTSSVASATASKDVSNAINLLKSFVKKLLTQNGTETTSKPHLNTSKIMTEMSEKKDTFKEKGSTNHSADTNRGKYNFTAVDQLRAKQKQALLSRLKEEEDKLRHNLLEKQHEIEQLGKVEEANSEQPKNLTAFVDKPANNIANPTLSVQTTKAPTHISQNAQNDTSEAQFKFDSLKGIPPELLVKLKDILDKKKQQKANLISKQQDSSRKAFETAKKLVKAAFARKQLYKAEQDFYEKVREMMNKTSEANLIENKNSTSFSPDIGDEAESGVSSVKDYIHSLEEEQKVVESVERRTQPTPKTTDIEAFQSAANHVTPTSKIAQSLSTLSPSAQSSTSTTSNQPPAPSKAQRNANQSLAVTSEAVQSKPSPGVAATTTQNTTINQAHETQSASNKASSNTTVAQAPAQKSVPGSPPAQAPITSILNKLNHTKGPDEKNVEAAAHLEEKVAEQQDEMYEDLLRHTLNKGRLDDDDDDDDYEDEEAATRDRAGRPAQYGQMSQENYGDFQDSDERAHARSEVINKKNDPKLHYIDENAIFSLKRNHISRPLKKAKHRRLRKPGSGRFFKKKHF